MIQHLLSAGCWDRIGSQTLDYGVSVCLIRLGVFGTQLNSFSVCHILISSLHSFTLFCLPLTNSRSFWLDLLELLSDNDTRFAGHQTSAPPISVPPPNTQLSTCQSCFSRIQVAIVLMIHFPCNPRSG